MVTKKSVLALCAFAAASVGALSGVFGATTPFTTASVELESVPDGVTGKGYDAVAHSNPAEASTKSLSEAGSWGSVVGFASADLSTGQLKVEAASSDPFGGTHPYINVNAYFGDSFTTSTAGNQPFSWTSSTTAQFSMTLDGTLSPSDDLAAESASAFILLLIYDKGTLDPNASLLGSNLIGQPYLWTIGNAGIQLHYTDKDGNSTPVTATGNFDSIPPSITQAITPGGDFDWVLLLGAGGQPDEGQSFDADFSHTLTLSYAGPQGTTTTSDSGMFENIRTSVPEPGSVGLVLLGLGGMMVRRRSGAERARGGA